jgi:RNA polymerase sigma-70 factor, ECF subfamily
VSTNNETARAREARFAELFADSYGPVLGYVRRRVGAESAEDVVGEVFYTAWRHFDKAPSEPLPWLYRIAWHAVGNQWRGQARDQRVRQRVQALAPRLQVADHADDVVGRDALAAAFAALAEPDREVLRLVCWEDLRPADAARVLGCSAATFRVRLHRARRHLAGLLQDIAVQGVGQQVSMINQENR